jgi:hypothetical protein
MQTQTLIGVIVLCLSANLAHAADKTIGVFVALADNQSQGIVRVPDAIGNGEDPERNLYWGTAEGLKGVFDRIQDWELTEKKDRPENAQVLRIRIYHNARKSLVLHAKAYKGSAIKECIGDFEAAIAAGAYDMVAFIGHNGLMDFELPRPTKSAAQARIPDCVVLCCKSEQYFKARIESAGGRPILLTTQLMYPGAFILRAAAESWADGQRPSVIRERAGIAYAENQKLSKKAGMGVFAEITD